MKRQGFTLIELMVAITIVAVISAIGYISYSAAQISSRDARRKQDLRALATALEVYHQANGRYPCTGGVAQVSNVIKEQPNQWIEDTCVNSTYLDQRYINRMVRDPLKDAGDPFASQAQAKTGYSYRTWTDSGGHPGCPVNDGQYYILAALLENPNDPDHAKITSGLNFCDGSSPPNEMLFLITTP
ncbi:type II secretion system protein [Candidatus Daviesbacteria bacterium]|nr:type II secretion system protein [Candidatus Daviesbacteria bacterium]